MKDGVVVLAKLLIASNLVPWPPAVLSNITNRVNNSLDVDLEVGIQPQ